MRKARKIVSVAIEQSEKQKKMSVWKHKTKVHIASLMDICHLENTDDAGAHAVFTESGSFCVSNGSCDSNGYHCKAV